MPLGENGRGVLTPPVTHLGNVFLSCVCFMRHDRPGPEYVQAPATRVRRWDDVRVPRERDGQYGFLFVRYSGKSASGLRWALQHPDMQKVLKKQPESISA